MLTRWERAYQAFETPDEELRKFIRRLRSVGADAWDRGSRVLEVCSGRGTGLRAWHALGFPHVFGVDRSLALVSIYRGPGRCLLADACALPLASGSCDIAIVQGGLHHLFGPTEVERALAEMTRVVGPAGRIVIVEPWLTPFLVCVHAVCNQGIARRVSPKINALAAMIDEERETYERWVEAPDEHLRLMLKYVRPKILRRRWGKIVLTGSPVQHST
jgi:ubiquinone/menaquinone biosynthesis C-methylase UbiE